MQNVEYKIGTRYFRNETEYKHFLKIRLLGFTEWYVGTYKKPTLDNNHHIMNLKARLFPDFFHEVRTKEDQPVAYLATVPAYWNGDSQSLQDLNYYEEILKFSHKKILILSFIYFVMVELLGLSKKFDSLISRFQKEKLAGCNSIVLIAMIVDPQFQKMRIPSLLIDIVRESAKKLGMRYIIAPFRPNGYGEYKSKQKLAHSEDLFKTYCCLKNEKGEPKDQWLRSVSHNDATFLKIENRSFRVTGSLQEFEKFRRKHKPDQWYSPVNNVWECGETPTWYVDLGKNVVCSVEPNYWGKISIDGNQN